MSEATAVATAPAVDTSLPYNSDVPGAVIGEWAKETDKALFVAADKLLPLLQHLRDGEGYDFLSSVTCVDYSAYKGKQRARHRRTFRRRLPPLHHQEGRRRAVSTCTCAGERDRPLGHWRVPWRQSAGARGVRPLRRHLRRASQSAPCADLGRVQRPSAAQGSGRKPISRKRPSPSRTVIRTAAMPGMKTSCPGATTTPTPPAGIRTHGRRR